MACHKWATGYHNQATRCHKIVKNISSSSLDEECHKVDTGYCNRAT